MMVDYLLNLKMAMEHFKKHDHIGTEFLQQIAELCLLLPQTN